MNKHNFYFRCKACNRQLSNRARHDSNGVIKEQDLCSICLGIALDTSNGREYEHQQTTDDFLLDADNSFLYD